MLPRCVQNSSLMILTSMSVCYTLYIHIISLKGRMNSTKRYERLCKSFVDLNNKNIFILTSPKKLLRVECIAETMWRLPHECNRIYSCLTAFKTLCDDVSFENCVKLSAYVLTGVYYFTLKFPTLFSNENKLLLKSHVQYKTLSSTSIRNLLHTTISFMFWAKNRDYFFTQTPSE